MKTVIEFENKIAEFFGAPYAVAVDSCTHGLELCLRYKNVSHITVPKRTYLSVPMLANKLNVLMSWIDLEWSEGYFITPFIGDFAVAWRKDLYKPFYWGVFLCISFQYQKHLSLGRGGMILCPDKQSYDELKLMSYDGREPNTPWREQNIKTMGYHYYMTPETAELGLSKLQKAIDTPPRIWSHADYPDVSQFDVFK